MSSGVLWWLVMSSALTPAPAPLAPAAIEKDPDGRYAWERKRGESVKAYEAFRVFLDSGRERSTLATSVKCNCSRQLIVKWAGQHAWHDRAAAHDSYLEAVEVARREQVRAEYAKRAERFRMESANANIDVASKLFQRCLEMLDTPLFVEEITETYEDGRAKTIIRTPVRNWSARDIPAFAKAAADLAQLAIFQMSFAEDDAFDPTTASIEELREYVERHGGAGKARELPAPMPVPGGQAANPAEDLPAS